MEVLSLEIEEEEWRDVVGFEGLYEVSNKGKVRSLHGTSPRILKYWLSKGYPSVDLRSFVSKRKTQIHTLVLEAFVGPRPYGMEACHNDGNKQNNCLQNLRWDTRSGNFSDKARHGTDNKGERHPLSKLSVSCVTSIREALFQGESQRALAHRFCVSQSQISRINVRKRWDHLPQ